MAEGVFTHLEDDVEGKRVGDDSKPATKGDEKKSKHLQYIGILVGVLALYFGYRWYVNRQAASGSTVTTNTSEPAASTPDTTDSTGGGGSGGGWSGYSGGTNPDPGNSGATVPGATSGTGGSSPWDSPFGIITSIPSITTTAPATTPATTGPEPESNAYTGSIPAAIVGTVTPTQAQAAVSQGIASPLQALNAEVPAAQETAAQRHAQEVANAPLRAQLKATTGKT